MKKVFLIIIGTLSAIYSMAALRIDSVTINIIDTTNNKIIEQLVSPDNYHLYDLEDDYNGPDSLYIELDYTRLQTPKVRCKSVDDFKSLVDTPYVYNGIWTSCDVNEDGLTDYLLNVKGTDSSNWEPYLFNEDSLVDRNKRGFILVINRGDYFETDIRNYDCFPSENDRLNYPKEFDIWASKNSLLIEYWQVRYGSWKYEFIYRSGNYVLISFNRHYTNGPLLEKIQDFDLDNNRLRVYKLQHNSYLQERGGVDDDKYYDDIL